jgi:hypothetical protein
VCVQVPMRFWNPSEVVFAKLLAFSRVSLEDLDALTSANLPREALAAKVRGHRLPFCVAHRYWREP